MLLTLNNSGCILHSNAFFLDRWLQEEGLTASFILISVLLLLHLPLILVVGRFTLPHAGVTVRALQFHAALLLMQAEHVVSRARATSRREPYQEEGEEAEGGPHDAPFTVREALAMNQGFSKSSLL